MVTKPASKKKLNKITISFDDEDEPETYSSRQSSTNQDRDLDLKLDVDETSPKPLSEKPRIKFKKITKKHAARIKEEEEDSEDSPLQVKTEDPQLDYNTIKKEEGSGIEAPQLTIDLLQKAQNRSILSLLASKERQRQQSIIKPEPDPEHRRAILSDNEPEQDIANDRAWYTQDEQSTNPYLDEDDYFDYEATSSGPDFSATKISQIIETKRKQNQRFKRQRRNSGESQWFDNRMGMAAGSSTRINEADEDDINEVSNDIDLVVHRLAPPFLDSATIMSDKLEIIDTIRDKTGDLYKYSRNGSGIVNERRLEKDKKKSAEEATSINDTKIGKILANDNNTTKEIDSSNENDDNFINALGEQSSSSDFSANLSLKQQREFLPAFKSRSELLKTINENQVIVVIGETGSGKTTQIAQFLYEEGYQNRGLIGVTQPRRVAAMSVAKRVSEEMGVKLGDEVGFSIRFEDFTSDKTKIKFMTDGILLRETLSDPELNKYSCIIMDEAHERSLNTDILLGLFKGILARRRDLKLIVTSATMNADKFSRFFGNAEQFTIPGRTFPVDIMFSTVPSVDYVETAVKQVLRIHLGEKDQGDILCFMTGQEDIETTVFEINKELDQLMKLDESIKPLEILPIYSTLPADLQAKIFKKSKIRKCVVSTNIAETSLTVDGIKYVVDTGLMKLKVYNPKLGMDSLQITPISLAQANQRSGRAGRTGPGKCYRMYTQTASAKEMFVQPIPEIQRTNLSHTILLLKSLNVKDLNKFPFLDRPPIETINTAQYDLWVLGALNNFGDLTPLGLKNVKVTNRSSFIKVTYLIGSSPIQLSR